jgi:hypothetical protein
MLQTFVGGETDRGREAAGEPPTTSDAICQASGASDESTEKEE